jgi:Holliday junction resolvase RusA-like endonuclease
MTRIVVDLPYPLSINQIWRSSRGRVYRSAEYTAWIKQAGLEWLFQRKSQPRTISGPFSAYLVLVRQTKKSDLDNLSKCILDFCQAQGLITNDNLCEKLYLRWGSAKEAPLGARLILKGL